MSSLRKRKTTELEDKKELKPQNKTQKKQSQVKEKDGVYDIIMLLKYWKATIKEPIKDLCNIIGKFYKNIEEGLLYATGYQAALTVDNNGHFKDIDTLSHIPLKNKDGDNVLVKDVMNGSWIVHAFLLENGKMRVIEEEGSFDIELESGIIKMNSGNHCKSLFVIDKKMRAYEIKNKTAVIITGLNGIKIKDISCGCQFTLLLSKSGQLYGLGLNIYSILGLPRRIEKTEIPTKITFPNQDDSDKNGIIITMMHASMLEYVAVDSKHRAWIIGDDLTQFVSSYYEFLDPSISIVQVWHSNNIRITQIKCGCNHVIALDTEGKVYWFGQFEFDYNDSLPVSSDPIPFSHKITLISSGVNSVACKDETNEWYVWGNNASNLITGLCGCEAVCKKTRKDDIISNPMRCEWQSLFDSSRVIDLQLGLRKVHVIIIPV